MLVSLVNQLYQKLSENKITTLLLIYHLTLFFSPSKKILFLLAAFFFLALWQLTKNFVLSAFIFFIINLPFAKGIALELTLLPIEQIEHYAFFGIKYFFPFYLADVFLALIVFQYLKHRKKIKVNRTKLYSLFFFTTFLTVISANAVNHQLGSIIFLSVTQLIRMLAIFFLPELTKASSARKISKEKLKNLIIVALAISTLFQAVWVLLQRFKGGPLNLDLEVYLPLVGAEYGIQASENRDILRLAGTFFEPSILGTFLITNSSLLLFTYFREKNTNQFYKKLNLLAVILSSIAIIFTGSRIIYLIYGLALIYIFKKFKNKTQLIKKQLRKFRLLVIGLGLTVLILAGPFLWQRILTFSDVFTKYGSASYRLGMARFATRLGLKRAEGVGLNLSPYFLASKFKGVKYIFDPTYPHNLFFQLFAETGLIGLISFLSWLYLVFRDFLVGKKGSDNGFGLAGIIFIAASMFYPIFLNHPEISSFLFLFAGLHIYFKKYQTKIG